jgi:hypothetical protein
MSSESRRRTPDFWTFVPLYTALFIIGTYILVYAAFVVCSKRLGAGCDAVTVERLLQEVGRCDAAGAKSGAPAEQPNSAAARSVAAAAAPTQAPTPVVTIKTEGGGATPQMSVQVTFPAATAPTPAPPEPKRPEAAYASRILWMLLYAVGVITALVSLFVSARVIWQSLRNDFGALGRLAALCVVFVVSLLAVAGAWRLSEGNLPVLQPLMECVAAGDVGRAFFVVKVGNMLGLFLALVMLLAGCAALWPVRKVPVDAAVEIAERMRLLRLLLYAGMVALVVAVLRLDATFRWALSPLPKDDAAVKLIESITASVVSAEAAAYTLLLAAMYVPASLVLRRRARMLITREKGYTQAMGDEWLEKHGMNVEGSLRMLWPKLAAILAPLVVGSAGELFKGLGALY